MEQKKRVRRVFTVDQKMDLMKKIESAPTIQEGLESFNIGSSVYRRWKRQYMVGIHAALRGGKLKSDPEKLQLRRENRRLKEAMLNQALMIAELKKEMNLDF